MIVYNLSIKIHAAIEAEWVKWQQLEHIPEVMASGCFTEYKFYRLLSQEEEEDSVTFIIQYSCPDMNSYNTYIEKYAPLIRQKAFSKWGNQFIAFRTIMQSV
jgi:hypothetical protein